VPGRGACRGRCGRLRASLAEKVPGGAETAFARVDRIVEELACPPRGRAGGYLQLRRARQGGEGFELSRVLKPAEDPEDRGTEFQGLGRAADIPDEGEPPRSVSIHRRRLSISPAERRSHPHVRRGRNAGAHQPPLSLPVTGTGSGTVVHRLRFRDAL